MMARRYWRTEFPVDPVEQRRRHWAGMLVGIVSEFARDGCQHVTDIEIDALGVLIRHAKKDIDRRIAEKERAKVFCLPDEATPGILSTLTGEQKKRAFAYDGPENHGDPEFRLPSLPDRPL